MSRKTVKTVVYIIVIAMLITSFSFVFFMPAVFAADGKSGLYGAAQLSEKERIEKELRDRQSMLERMELLRAYIEFIQGNYKDEIDYDTLLDGAFEGAMKALDDPFSVYFVTKEEAESFTSAVSGTFYGVGVQIQMNNDNEVVVLMPVANSPAYKAGIKAGDVIVEVNGESVAGLSLNQVTSLIRGDEGTKVSVRVKRGSQTLTFSLVRAEINESCIDYSLTSDNIGVITMSGFDSDCDYEFEAAYDELVAQGAERLILDLRNNGGGYMDNAIAIADYLLEDCLITQYQARGEIIETIKANDGYRSDLPMVVLVNEGTASASELLAGALQCSGVPVVGTTTYGKGISQSLLYLTDGNQFKLSTFYFLTPAGKQIQDVGIIPDYAVSYYTTSESRRKELTDAYLAFAPMSEERKLSKGETGLNVFGAQQRLVLLGYETAVNGTMGDDTVAAVKRFQQDNGLYPYGVLDYTTMDTLNLAAYRYAYGAETEDVQMQKALEVLKGIKK